MISINASYTDLVNQRTLATNTKNLNKATERLSTGMKINHANDDAAGLFVGSGLSSSLSGMKIALDNTMLASNFLNIADGALSNISDNLNRMNTLATQACSGIMSDDARNVLQAEMEALAEQCDVNALGAKMNGTNTLNYRITCFIDSVNSTSKSALVAGGAVACTSDNLSKAENTNFFIESADQLQALATAVNGGADTSGKTFTLVSDIDLSGIDNWTAIGTSDNKFAGTFDGNGKFITNLTINNSSTDYQGLFGYADGATFKDIALTNVDITGKSNDGALVGQLDNGSITNAYITGEVNGTGYVGGLVGQINLSTITKAYSTANVTSSGAVAGGLAAAIQDACTLSNTYATGDVSATSGAGGLVGKSNVTAYTADSITATSSLGRSYINNSYATGNVSCGNYTGGLLGVCYKTTVQETYATGDVLKNTGKNKGGLVGFTQGATVQNSYATGNVNGNIYLGGLVGYASRYSNVFNGYALGNVNASVGNNDSGALVGTVAYSQISNLYYSGEITNISSALGVIKAEGIHVTVSNVHYTSASITSGVGKIGSATSDSDYTLDNVSATASPQIDKSAFTASAWDNSGALPTLNLYQIDQDRLATANAQDVINPMISFQVSDGYDANSSIEYDSSISLDFSGLDLSSVSAAKATLAKLQATLQDVTQKQSYIGTQLNRLTGIATSSQMTIENYSAAKSTVMDTDVAQETANMVKSQILQQVSVSVLAQSKNITGQIALSLIK